MATLYEINAAITDALNNALDEETGEILDEKAFEAYNLLSIEKDEKVENIGLYIKNLLSDAESYKAEKLAFAEKQKKAEARAEWLKNYLKYCLAGEKFKSTRVEVSYRKSMSVEIDTSAISAEWLKALDPTKEENYRKSDITKALKGGEEIPGASLIEKTNISIK